MENRTTTLEKNFASIYEKEVDAIFRFCLLRVSDREKAMDLTQETFMRFWDALRKGGETLEYPKAFLFKVAKNLIIDWYRKKKTVSLEAELEDEDILHDGLLVDKNTLDALMLTEGRFVLEKISELEPLYQQVVYMRFVEGMQPREIAEILDESVNVVSVRITRGIEKLRVITGYEKKS